jgi:hypothetical protein
LVLGFLDVLLDLYGYWKCNIYFSLKIKIYNIMSLLCVRLSSEIHEKFKYLTTLPLSIKVSNLTIR